VFNGEQEQYTIIYIMWTTSKFQHNKTLPGY